jgi:hypothetical protein
MQMAEQQGGQDGELQLHSRATLRGRARIMAIPPG